MIARTQKIPEPREEVKVIVEEKPKVNLTPRNNKIKGRKEDSFTALMR